MENIKFNTCKRKYDSQYLFRRSIFFNKFAGNCSTLVQKTNFWEQNTIFELHNTIEAAYISTKKQACWKCCSESLVLNFHKSLGNILCSFLPFQLMRTCFTSFILRGFFCGKKFALISPNCFLPVIHVFCYYLAHLREAPLYTCLWTQN